jgi:hypothetical protein
MIVIQLQEDNKIIENMNCPFNDTIGNIQKYLNQYSDIETIVVVGQTNYADKMEQLVEINFKGLVNIERINN